MDGSAHLIGGSGMLSAGTLTCVAVVITTPPNTAYLIGQVPPTAF